MRDASQSLCRVHATLAEIVPLYDSTLSSLARPQDEAPRPGDPGATAHDACRVVALPDAVGRHRGFELWRHLHHKARGQGPQVVRAMHDRLMARGARPHAGLPPHHLPFHSGPQQLTSRPQHRNIYSANIYNNYIYTTTISTQLISTQRQ